MQEDALNDNRINTVLMAAITSTIKGDLSGNVIVRNGETNMPKRGVINVTQIKDADKKSINELICTFTAERLDQVYQGILLVMGFDSLG